MPLKVTRRKNSQNWYLRGTVQGVEVNETTGTDNKQLAEQIRLKRENEITQRAIFGKQATITFGDAVIDYLEDGRSSRFIGTVKDDGTMTLLLGEFYNTRLSEIDESALKAAARRLYPTASPETLNRQLYPPCIAVYNHAKMPLRQWTRPKRKKGTLHARKATRAGANAVEYTHAAKFVVEMSPAAAMVMTALFYTGMRPIELFALHCDDVDIVNRWIVVRGSKTGIGRGLPLHSFIVPMFKALCSDAGHVFKTARNKPYVATGKFGGQISKSIRSARQATGIMDVSPYTARHSFISGLYAKGVPDRTIKSMAGHSGGDITSTYIHIPNKEHIKAVDKLPVPKVWKKAWWMDDPLGARSKFRA